MRRFLAILALGACVAGPAAAQDDMRSVRRIARLEGWIVADHCGPDNATPEARDRVLACFERGEDLLFQTKDGELYKIAAPEAVLDKIGKPWVVLGSVDRDDVLSIGSIFDPKDPARGTTDLGVKTRKPAMTLKPMSKPPAAAPKAQPAEGKDGTAAPEGSASGDEAAGHDAEAPAPEKPAPKPTEDDGGH